MEIINDRSRFIAKIDHCDLIGFSLSDSLKRRMINELTGFEECDSTKEELLKMSDQEFSEKYYWVCLEYARSQGY